MKFLLWGLIALALVLWLLDGKKAAVRVVRSGPSAAKANDAELIIQCVHCGMHVPASESIVAPSGAIFCCEAHRLRHVAS